MRRSFPKYEIKGKGEIFGLDIGKSGIKIALISKNSEKRIVLNNLAFHDFPLHNLEHIDNPTVIQTMRNAVSKLGLETDKIKAVVNVYGTEPIIKFITLPYMSEEELNKTIRLQAQRFITHDLDKMYIDYAVMNVVEEKGAKKIILVLAGVMKEAILNQLEILKEVNIEPVSIEVDFLAQFHLARYRGIFLPNEVVCIIDIGLNSAIIQVIDNGVPCFVRECINIGSFEINKAIKEALKVSMEEIEKIKREISLKSLDTENKEVNSIIKKVIGDTVTEIRRSLDYYYDIAPQKTVERILLTGGGALLNGLDEYIKRQLGIKVDKFDPLKDIEFSEKIRDKGYLVNNSLRFTTAMGLAWEAIS